MYKAKVLLVIVFIFSIASVSHAFNVIYVDVNGPNNPGTGSYEDPFRRIQDGLDSADSNDTVIIAEGIYTGNGNYDLDPNGKSIIIRSTEPNDPEIVANTIIDPNGTGRGFYFHSGEDANCVVAGLTIRNAATNGSGGAIACGNSSPTIKNCVIIGNTAIWGGGGILCWLSSSTITNCIVADNTTKGKGGGIWAESGDISIVNCTISGNSADLYGGAVQCKDSNVTISNSILWDNQPEQINVTSGNIAVTYSDVQNSWVGTGNIDADPCFAWFDPNGDPNLWDFHLQSAYGRWEPNSQSWVNDVNTSACIDTGDPNSDWSSELWPNGKRINMGAYGGTNWASMNGNAADFDISGSVNFVDFAEFSDKWLAQQNCIEDLNRDEVVDFADVRIFAENWLWQKE